VLKIIDVEVQESVLAVLKQEKLFRYDCEDALESPTALFEREFSKLVGSKYAVAMNSCSSGLFVSLLCAGVTPNDKVAIPAFTFIAVPSAIIHAGAQPVLIEVDDNYVMNLDDFEAKAAGGGIKALMLSYMRGRVPDIDKVMSLCQQYDITLLEDSAHSLGVLWKGNQTGTFGLSGVFSAQSYKMIDGGEGGILVTDDDQTAFKAMLYSGCYENNWKKHFGTKLHAQAIGKLINTLPAYNFRMSNLSAAALMPQLKKIDQRVQHFNSNFNRLATILLASPHIRLPEFTKGTRPAPDSIQWEFKGLTPAQIAFIKQHLQGSGIRIEVFTGDNARCFWNWGFFKHHEECPYTRELIQNTVDLRLRPYLTSDDIDEIGAKVLAAIQEAVA